MTQSLSCDLQELPLAGLDSHAGKRAEFQLHIMVFIPGISSMVSGVGSGSSPSLTNLVSAGLKY